MFLFISAVIMLINLKATERWRHPSDFLLIFSEKNNFQYLRNLITLENVNT